MRVAASAATARSCTGHEDCSNKKIPAHLISRQRILGSNNPELYRPRGWNFVVPTRRFRHASSRVRGFWVGHLSFPIKAFVSVSCWIPSIWRGVFSRQDMCRQQNMKRKCSSLYFLGQTHSKKTEETKRNHIRWENVADDCFAVNILKKTEKSAWAVFK